jgi:cold shock CspA family protein
MRAGVVTHFLPLSPRGEKGVDVSFALEAFELAMYKRFGVTVLIAGDGDYLPLIRKLHTIGTRTMVLAWDFKYIDEAGNERETKTSQLLIDEATYRLEMHTVIDARSSKKDQVIDGLFVQRKETPPESVEASRPTSDGSTEPRSGSIVTAQDGYGFVRPDGGGDNLFFHHSSLLDTDYADLAKGDKVIYVLGRNAKGPCALRLKKG